jgi:hypothetical protein
MGLYSAGVVGETVFGMHITIPCFCCSLIRPSKYIWLNRASVTSFMVSQFPFKNYRQMPSLPGAMLQAPLFTAVFSPSAVLGVSRKSLHPIGKILCTAISISVTHASSTCIRSYLLCRYARKACRMPVVVVCVRLGAH